MNLCHSTDAYGVSMLNPTSEALHELLDSLDDDTISHSEHPDVSLTNDTIGWAITVYPSGIATLENLDAPEEKIRFMSAVTRNEVLGLWLELQAGRIASILEQPWDLQDK